MITFLSNGKHHVAKKTDEVYSFIYETFDYDKFKILEANRNLKKNNYNGLVNSFKEDYLLAIVIVNENMEIIDGQHRYNAAKELGLPIRYTIAPNYGIKEVRQYNKTMQKWVRMDYLDSFVTEEKDAYVTLKEFMTTFPDFGIKVSLSLLTGKQRGGQRLRRDGSRFDSKDFENGDFELNSVSQAYTTGRRICDFKEFYKEYYNVTFINALISVMRKKGYDHKRMLQKLKSCPTRLGKCANVEQYKMLLQKIYNYHVSANEKVVLIDA
jgi:hypothetical protein